ncbi:hypothetical protein [Aquiflexum gelatinilyticum]|uniref:hypothetical protein n=1 Tax=Aquiflexum gelatinilyticum TaxID=2961943 RepID=UPI002167D794|nr:hypothetical protein [Aquiflexum gelatinilyticum]MCS4432854.1 hypothetical protein [Aquiflexum gelatinilyticum]
MKLNNEGLHPQDINSISNKLLDMLVDIARQIIETRPENENFLINPDDPIEHVSNWHQFGIITHTKVVLDAYIATISEYFINWQVEDKIKSKLEVKIDNIAKHDLIKIGIILHDIGKFARKFKNEGGKLEHNFYGHEEISETLIVSEDSFIHKLLKNSFGLTIPQIAYIGRIAGLHFELGKSRDAARRASHGYSISFSESKECEKVFLDIASNFHDFKEEIGILFLCDSLGKTDIRIRAEKDEEIDLHIAFISQALEERKINPLLINAIKQLPVNIAITKKYLQTI